MFDSLAIKLRIRKIRELMKAERKLILEGPLDAVLPISEKCEKLVSGLIEFKGSISPDCLADLNKLANENRRLIEASIRGVRLAKKQLIRDREELTQIGTYTSSGQKDKFCTPLEGSDRRA